jgi:hypothetical protein
VRTPAVRFTLASLLWTAALAPGALLGQEAPFQATFGDRILALQEAAGGWQLHGLGEEARPLKVPAGASASALVALGNRWLAVGSAVDGEGVRRLLLIRGDEDSSRSLEVPTRQRGQLRQGAVPLVDQGKLVGLAWLEGDSQRGLEVRSAAWTGRRWRRPQVVAAAGPGSQLALAGTVLADGSWLLAWSAFDGQDDEILTARRLGRHWSEPQPVSANEVPDITPALVARGSGALLAWSRYDGSEYRLRQARFDGGAWVEERVLGNGGTLYPRYLDRAPDGPSGTAVLVYRDARQRGWAALEVSEAGRPGRYLVAPDTAKTRPVVETSVDGARLRWPSYKNHPDGQGEPGDALETASRELPWTVPPQEEALEGSSP